MRSGGALFQAKPSAGASDSPSAVSTTPFQASHSLGTEGAAWRGRARKQSMSQRVSALIASPASSALVENLFDRTETGRGRRPQHRRRYDGRACDLRRDERMLAARRRRTVEVAVLDERLPRAARAERRGGARGAGVEVSDTDRADASHLGRTMPDLRERLVPHVP